MINLACKRRSTIPPPLAVLSKPGGVLVLQTLIKWEEERAAHTRQLELAREEGA